MIDKTTLLTSSFDKTIVKCSVIKGRNPYYLNIKGIAFYVYIIECAPSMYSDDGTIIFELTHRILFDDIKKSALPFVLLGYDELNDVYVTWDPYHTKGRLNGRANVFNLYSNKSEHLQAHRDHAIKIGNANNGENFVVFPKDVLYDYLMNLNNYFHDTSAIKSVSANKLFSFFNDIDRLPGFSNYLVRQGYKKDSKSNYNYCCIIEDIIKHDYFDKNKNLFINFTSVTDYKNALAIFCKTNEIVDLNTKWRGVSAALSHYIKYIQYCIKNEVDVNVMQEVVNIDSSDVNWYVDWEDSCTDDKGKLNKICNPKLIKLLMTHKDYPNLCFSEAYEIINNFYSGRFNIMRKDEWARVYMSIEWPRTMNVNSRNPSFREKIRVILPNGIGLQYGKVCMTLCEFIKYVTPEKIYECRNRVTGLGNWVVRANEKSNFNKNIVFKEIDGGWWVMTTSDTYAKRRWMEKINEELHIGALIMSISDNDRCGLDTFKILKDITLDDIKKYSVVNDEDLQNGDRVDIVSDENEGDVKNTRNGDDRKTADICYKVIDKLGSSLIEKKLNDHLFFWRYNIFSRWLDKGVYLYVDVLTDDNAGGKTKFKIEDSKELKDVVGSDNLFVAVGYDPKIRVFVVWDPYEIRNNIINVDFNKIYYSTKTYQQKGKDAKDITEFSIDGEKLVIFPTKKLRSFLYNLDQYFRPKNDVEMVEDDDQAVCEFENVDAVKENEGGRVYKVIFSPKMSMCDDNLVNILKAVVGYAGVVNVNKLRILLKDINLVSRYYYVDNQIDIGYGWYLMTGGDENELLACMKLISDRLNLELKFEGEEV